MAQTIAGATKIVAKIRGMSVPEFIAKSETHKWCYIGKHWQVRSLFKIDNSHHDKIANRCKECTKAKNPYSSLKGRVSTFKGKKHTVEAKLKNSIAQKELIKSGIRKPPMEGKKHTVEAKLKISKILRERGAKGPKCHSYKDGKMHERRGFRFTNDYRRWRFDVFARDKFACQKCGDKKGGNLNAHHIKAFADYPELRLNIDNGITLCEKCHEEEHYKPDSIRNIKKAKNSIKSHIG